MEFKDMYTRTDKKSNFDEIIKESKKKSFFNRDIISKIFGEKPVVSGENNKTIIYRFGKEILIVVIVLVLVIGYVFSKNQIIDFLTDSDYNSIISSEDFNGGVSVDIAAKEYENSTDFVINSISDWAKKNSAHEYNNNYFSPLNMKNEISNILGEGKDVFLAENLDNYTFFEMTYNSLKKNTPVIVSGTNFENGSIEYAIVTAFSPSDNKITVLTKDGVSNEMDLEGFTHYIGLESFTKGNDNLIAKVAFGFGIFNQNTAIFIF